MQDEFVLVISSRPTLGKIETTLQIGYALGKVREKAILNHKPKYKKWLVTKTMYIEAGAQAVRYTTSRVYFESLTGVVWHMFQTTSKVVYISASAPAPMRMHGIGHVTFSCTCTYDLILHCRKLFQGHSQFTAWFLSYLGWVYSKSPRRIRFVYFDFFGWTP